MAIEVSERREAGSRSGRSFRRGALCAGFLALILLLIAVPFDAGMAKGRADGVAVVGRLPEPPEAGESHRYVIGIDEKRDKLYYLWRRGSESYITRYDLSTLVPTAEREEHIGTYSEFQLDYASPYTVAVDYERQLAYVMGLSIHGTPVRVVDLRSLKVLGTWDLGTQIPGFFGEGISYSPEDERLYIVGHIYGEGHGKVVSQLAQVSPAAGVIAVQPPEQRDGQPVVAWARAVPECQYVLSTYVVGALIARSADRPALYFACVRTDIYPGESGLVRLWVDPKADGHAAAAAFDSEFFPISGAYTRAPTGVTGTAAFDPKSERFFMQSVSNTTPGAWVFDGRMSSWVGFVTAPNDENRYLGLDPESGRFYMGSPEFLDRPGYVLVTDGRATPIPQGRIYRGPGVEGFLVSGADRLFVRMKLSTVGMGKENAEGFVVLKDHTPDPERPRPVDYDEITSDLPEGPKAITDYSAGVSGFGARAVLVGGYGGILSAGGGQVEISQLRAGDRGMTFARVTSLDLRSSGAAATAQAVSPDLNTEGDLQDGAAQEWPWRPVSCLNGGGETVSDEDSQHGGSAAVECDLEAVQATAEARSGEIQAGGIFVIGAEMRTRARRDPKLGTVTEVATQATGIKIPTPQGTLSIAKVESRSTTAAFGHAKTSAAEWQRVVSGVEILDPDGEVVERLGSCDSADEDNPCGPLEDQINELLPQRLKVDFPDPRIVATPKGAFAGVEQSDADFYHSQTVNNQGTVFTGEEGARTVPAMQITVYNDTREKSRLLLQLAAVQANSIYTITPKGSTMLPGSDIGEIDLPGGDALGGDVGGGSGVSGGVELDDLGQMPVASGDPAPPPEDVSEPVLATQPLEGPMALLARSPQEAVLVGLVWLTFVACGWVLFRRWKLLDVLRAGGR